MCEKHGKNYKKLVTAGWGSAVLKGCKICARQKLKQLEIELEVLKSHDKTANNPR